MQYMEQLAADCEGNTILVGYPGHEDTLPSYIASFEELIGILIHALSKLDLTKVKIIIGHSLGTWVAHFVSSTLDFPEIKKIINICWPSRFEFSEELRLKFLSQSANLSSELRLEKNLVHYFLDKDNLSKIKIDKNSFKSTYNLYLSKLKISQALVSSLSKNNVHYFIFGEMDLIAPHSTSENLSNVFIIGSSAHFPMLENPKKFDELMKNIHTT